MYSILIFVCDIDVKIYDILYDLNCAILINEDSVS